MNLKTTYIFHSKTSKSYAKEEAHARWRVDCSDGYNRLAFRKASKAASSI